MNKLNKTLLGLGLLTITSGEVRLNAMNSQINLDNELLNATRSPHGNHAYQRIKNAIEGGANVNARDAQDKRTALHNLVPLLSETKELLELIKLLIDKGADPNAKDSMGETPLHFFTAWYALGNTYRRLELLFKAGADVNAKNNQGETPLFNFIGSNFLELPFKPFVEKGANIFTIKDNKGQTIWKSLDNWNIQKNRVLETFFPLKEIMESVKEEPFVKIVKKNTAEPSLTAILTVFAKQLTDKEDSVTLTKEQIKELKKIDSSLTEIERETLIYIVQKFIRLLYIGKDGFKNELSKKRNRLGFGVKEILLYNKLFTKTSPLLNLLEKYFQGWSKYSELFMKKNFQKIAPTKDEKKPKLSDIKVLFKK